MRVEVPEANGARAFHLKWLWKFIERFSPSGKLAHKEKEQERKKDE